MEQISGWRLFGRKQVMEESKDFDISKAFKQEKKLMEEDQHIIEGIDGKLICDCEKDPWYKFACKQGVSWFCNDTLITKIKRKQ